MHKNSSCDCQHETILGSQANAGRATSADVADWGQLPVENWPESWSTYNQKTYPRIPELCLPSHTSATDIYDADELLRSRESARTPTLSISAEAAASTLWRATHATALDGQSPWHRPYPSAGGRLSSELYLISNKINDIPRGAYNYNVLRHSLTPLRSDITPRSIAHVFGAHWIVNSCAILVVSVNNDRLAVKYGDRGHRYALLEAGALTQTICLAAEIGSLASCVVGGFSDSALSQLLFCTPHNEYPVAAIVLNSQENEIASEDTREYE